MALPEAMRQRIAQNKNKYSKAGGKAIKLKEGQTRLRILPVDLGDGEFSKEYGVHWIKQSENAKPHAVVGCEEITYGRTSKIRPLVEQAVELAKASGDAEMTKVTKDWLARRSILCVAMIRDGADKSDSPQILELTPTTFGKFNALLDLYLEAGLELLDVEGGQDVVISRKGKGLDTEYDVALAPPSSKFPALSPSVMDNVPDIEAYIAREFFRGEENKAISAICTWTGLPPTAALSGPSGAPLLTAVPSKPKNPGINDAFGDQTKAKSKPAPAAAEVTEDDIIIDEDAPPFEPTPPTPPAAPVKPAPKAASAKPKAAPAAPPPAAEVKTAASFNEDISEDELDNLLSGL